MRVGWDAQQAMLHLLCETCKGGGGGGVAHSKEYGSGGGGWVGSYPAKVKLAGLFLPYEAGSRQGSSYPVKCASSG